MLCLPIHLYIWKKRPPRLCSHVDNVTKTSPDKDKTLMTKPSEREAGSRCVYFLSVTISFVKHAFQLGNISLFWTHCLMSGITSSLGQCNPRTRSLLMTMKHVLIVCDTLALCFYLIYIPKPGIYDINGIGSDVFLLGMSLMEEKWVCRSGRGSEWLLLMGCTAGDRWLEVN